MIKFPLKPRYKGSAFYIYNELQEEEEVTLSICSNSLHYYFDFPVDIPIDLIILEVSFDNSYKINFICHKCINIYTIDGIKHEYLTGSSISILDKFKQNIDYFVGIEY